MGQHWNLVFFQNMIEFMISPRQSIMFYVSFVAILQTSYLLPLMQYVWQLVKKYLVPLCNKVFTVLVMKLLAGKCYVICILYVIFVFGLKHHSLRKEKLLALFVYNN